MRYWFDTEFIEDGRTIDLISIGIVSEDGRTLYMENAECDLTKASGWVRKNVFPQLNWTTTFPKIMIRNAMIQFLQQPTEIWAYYSAYDWVAFCQLWGRMIDMPGWMPKNCFDVKQLAVSKGNPELPKQYTPEHHALNDAIWTSRAWQFLQGYNAKECSG